MKTIIIPFNASANFLDLTETIVSVSGNENVDCIFLSVYALPDNYNDLFSLNTSPFTSQKNTEIFYRFSAVCKKLFGNRVSVSADHIYGDSPAVFRNYAQHKNADMVVFDAAQWEFSDKRTRSGIFRMLTRSGCELLYVSTGSTMLKPAHVFEKENKILEKEMVAAEQMKDAPIAAKKITTASKAVMYQYSAVNDMLNEWENKVVSNHVFSKKLGTMPRYFLKEAAVQKMLGQSQCSFMLLGSKG